PLLSRLPQMAAVAGGEDQDALGAFWGGLRDRVFAPKSPGESGEPDETHRSDSLPDEILRLSGSHGRPLVVVGIVCRSPHAPLTASGLLDQICLRDSSASEVNDIFDANLGRVRCVYQDRDNVLFLCLEAAGCEEGGPWAVLGSATKEASSGGDAEFLANCGWEELKQLANLLLLLNLCHALLWLCPGASPRVDGEALRSLAQLQELQGHPRLQPLLSANRPTTGPPQMLFVHAELKLPFLKAVGPTCDRPAPRHLLESAEKALDGKWRSCLKRLKLVSDSKRSGSLRLQRPCAAALSGPFQRLDLAEVMELVLDQERPGPLTGAEDPLATSASSSWPTDIFRARVSNLLETLASDLLRKGSSTTLQEWMSSAKSLRQKLRDVLEPASVLPHELEGIIEGRVEDETSLSNSLFPPLERAKKKRHGK
ncbi:unnamed protein product, partial [Polarella glacialis]